MKVKKVYIKAVSGRCVVGAAADGSLLLYIALVYRVSSNQLCREQLT